jgi:peptidylprolyl isomerase
MRKFFSAFVVSALLTAPVLAEDTPAPRTPNDIVAAAPAGDWKRIAPSDLLVMDLAPDAAGKARRVVIQLIPAPFSQGWVGNIRKLVATRWYDGIAVVRVQDNYVVQWGDPEGENPAKAKPLPKGLQTISEDSYETPYSESLFKMSYGSNGRRTAIVDLTPVMNAPKRSTFSDPYSHSFSFYNGFPIAYTGERVAGQPTQGEQPGKPDRYVPTSTWPTHCYGYVGVGRNNSPDTGTGAELYAVIGHAPRQLDRNVAIVGRVISGIENLSALPRGTGDIGFYKTPEERTAIRSIRMGNEVTGLPVYEYLSSESRSFAAYVDKRANRQDDFYIHPAGGVDVCNVPVPIREVK